MTIFKSQQVNLDPEPWLCDYEIDGKPVRSFFDGHGRYTWAPRPEFEPTRDPWPYTHTGGSRHAFPGTLDGERLVWAPRREQFDTPVNRVLVAFRDRDEIRFDPDTMEHRAVMFLANPIMVTRLVPTATPEEIDHARRVLTRLANWKDQ